MMAISQQARVSHRLMTRHRFMTRCRSRTRGWTLHRYLVIVVAISALLAACSGSDESSTQGDTQNNGHGEEGGQTITSADGEFELVAPDPDPTPIDVDDAVRVGQLDNGLTYYVRSNDSPGQRLSLRLAVNAGALQQDEPQSGIAHFLEHMMFNGTEKYPKNELISALEAIGVEFGADLNAYTSNDETVYSLDMAGVDSNTVQTGFTILSEWVSAATIAQSDVEAERGVIREEARLGEDTPEAAVHDLVVMAYQDGTVYEGLDPAGSVGPILATDSASLRHFYNSWYRPDLMAIVAVGDLPADELEQEIIDRFSDLEDRGETPPRIEPEVALRPEPFVEVFSDPELSSGYLSLDYPITNWDESTVGGERFALLTDVMALMIKGRFDDAVDRGVAELDEPFVGRFQQNRSQSFLGFNIDAPDYGVATEYVLTELRRIQLGGFGDAEYERAVEAFVTAINQEADQAPSTSDLIYADSYVNHFLGWSAASSAEDARDRLLGVLADANADEVTNLLRWELSRTQPIVVVVSPDEARLPTVAELEEIILTTSSAIPDSVSDDDSVAIEALMDRPEAVDPVSSNTIGSLDADEWVFENGVTVRFAPSGIVPDSVEMMATSNGGWSALVGPDAVIDAGLAPVAVAAVSRSGVGPHDRLSLRRFMNNSTVAFQPFITETEEVFAGSSESAELEVLFQRLHLAVTSPKIDAPSLSEAVITAENQRRSAETNAASAAQVALLRLTTGDDSRYLGTYPGLDTLDAEKALSIYQERFSSVDDLIVAVTGDISRDDVEDLAKRYLGTLPAGEPDSWVDVRPPTLVDVARKDLVVGSGEASGVVAMTFPSDFEIDQRTEVELDMLESILDDRFLGELRESLGASYSPFVIGLTRNEPRRGVDLTIFNQVDPNRVDEVYDVMAGETADLAANGPTSAEVDRARSVLQGNYDLVSNADLLESLLFESDQEIFPYPLRAQLLSEITTDDISRLAAQILSPTARAEVVVVPG